MASLEEELCQPEINIYYRDSKGLCAFPFWGEGVS